ncbi:hypothetical protein JB92DRAFT_1904746 [Gautieria morchelliformis]|nr:hypothetical protein JB92DRAFT_1904746 [Gautieria morchelliformis]
MHPQIWLHIQEEMIANISLAMALRPFSAFVRHAPAFAINLSRSHLVRWLLALAMLLLCSRRASALVLTQSQLLSTHSFLPSLGSLRLALAFARILAHSRLSGLDSHWHCAVSAFVD